MVYFCEFLDDHLNLILITVEQLNDTFKSKKNHKCTPGMDMGRGAGG